MFYMIWSLYTSLIKTRPHWLHGNQWHMPVIKTLTQTTHSETYENHEGTCGFSKKPYVNRYIGLCNPFSRISNSFPRISNSFPRIGLLVLSDCNSFPRIRQSVLSNCNSFDRIRQSVLSDCNSFPRILDNSFSRIAMCNSRDDLQLARTDFLIRGN